MFFYKIAIRDRDEELNKDFGDSSEEENHKLEEWPVTQAFAKLW